MGKNMKVLFATTNPAKVKKYQEPLKENGIELISIQDLDVSLEIEESGKNSVENAYIKAKAYYDATKLISIGMDVSLFIEELPPDKQIGTHIRRQNGKYLSDEEAIDYYIKLVKEYGGRLTAKWVYGMVIYGENGYKSYTWHYDHFYLIDKPCEKRNPGYPLDSISIIPKYQKYMLELGTEEKQDKDNKQDKVMEFIINSIRDLTENKVI